MKKRRKSTGGKSDRKEQKGVVFKQYQSVPTAQSRIYTGTESPILIPVRLKFDGFSTLKQH